jgi:hypothetical protein
MIQEDRYRTLDPNPSNSRNMPSGSSPFTSDGFHLPSA